MAPSARTPELDGTRRASRRPAIAGAATERLPVRACRGDEVGPQPVVRAVAEAPALRLTRRGQALLTAVSVLVFGSAVAVLGLRAAGALEDRPRIAGTTQVQLGAGQSLWSVARETNPAQDPARVIDEIARLNNLRSVADLRPGQLLVVPVFR
jgi:hypothetical protein